MQVILAIDGGGTRTRCAAFTPAGVQLACSEAGPSNHLQFDRRKVASALDSAIRATLEQAVLRAQNVMAVSAGLAGVDYDGAGAQEAREILTSIGYPDAAVHSDMVIAHRGALDNQPGILALAGTGSVFLSIGRDGRAVKAGGWGPAFGDEGSGYWIGAMALRAAAQAADGRGTPTLLSEWLVRAVGVAALREVVPEIYGSAAMPSKIAALAPAVLAAAEDGDSQAADILRRAGEELAEGVLALVRRDPAREEAVAVSYQGGVLRSFAPVREALRAKLTKEAPHAVWQAPRHEPLVGAFLLGCEAAGIARPALESACSS